MHREQGFLIPGFRIRRGGYTWGFWVPVETEEGESFLVFFFPTPRGTAINFSPVLFFSGENRFCSPGWDIEKFRYTFGPIRVPSLA